VKKSIKANDITTPANIAFVPFILLSS